MTDAASRTTAPSGRRPASAASVPSPPSASGSCAHATPASANPAASAAAASRAERTALRLSGHASALGLDIRLRLLRVVAVPAHLGLRGARHDLEHRERQALAREEDEPDADADRGLDRLQPEAVRDADRGRDAVARA